MRRVIASLQARVVVIRRAATTLRSTETKPSADLIRPPRGTTDADTWRGKKKTKKTLWTRVRPRTPMFRRRIRSAPVRPSLRPSSASWFISFSQLTAISVVSLICTGQLLLGRVGQFNHCRQRTTWIFPLGRLQPTLKKGRLLILRPTVSYTVSYCRPYSEVIREIKK